MKPDEALARHQAQLRDALAECERRRITVDAKNEVNSNLRAQIATLTRERDEARAEVERLRAAQPREMFGTPNTR